MVRYSAPELRRSASCCCIIRALLMPLAMASSCRCFSPSIHAGGWFSGVQQGAGKVLWNVLGTGRHTLAVFDLASYLSVIAQLHSRNLFDAIYPYPLRELFSRFTRSSSCTRVYCHYLFRCSLRRNTRVAAAWQAKSLLLAECMRDWRNKKVMRRRQEVVDGDWKLLFQ